MHGIVRSVALTRWAGFAAALGGALWVVKGGAILAITLDGRLLEFPLVVLGLAWVMPGFAPLLVALGLVGLHARLEGHGGGSGWVGGALAWASLALALVVVGGGVYLATTGAAGFPQSNATIALPGLSILASLVLLGIAVRRVGALPGRWRSFPLSMGVAGLPLIMISPMLIILLPQRLLELPLVVFGLAWVMLGWRISRSS